MARPSILREHRYTDSGLLLRCKGPIHANGTWLHVSHFHSNHRVGWQTNCKKCARILKTQRLGYETLVPVEPYRKWMREIVYRCGNMRVAAETIGTEYTTFLVWMGRQSYYDKRDRIRRESARRIISTLHGLRNGTIQPARKARKSYYRRGCKRCGVLDFYDYTPGCDSCQDRRYKHESRLRQAA